MSDDDKRFGYRVFLGFVVLVWLGIFIGFALAADKPSPVVKICLSYTCDSYGTAFHVGNGWFITAGHVAAGNVKKAYPKDSLGNKFTVETSWVAAQADISLFYSSVAANIMPAMPITCDSPKVGQAISITGNPYFLEHVTVSGSIISGPIDIDELKQVYVALIQVGPGGSGSPVMNSDGSAIGVLVAMIRGTTFALIEPISKVCNILPRDLQEFRQAVSDRSGE